MFGAHYYNALSANQSLIKYKLVRGGAVRGLHINVWWLTLAGALGLSTAPLVVFIGGLSER